MIEALFASLGREEKANTISHGVALRLAYLRKRLDMAESRVRYFEEKYSISLEELEAQKLPNDADYEMHEDYVMWHHWVEAVAETRDRITSLDEIAQQGLK